MRYSQEALEEMASKIDLYEYASHIYDFTKHYHNTHYCLCPFHYEKTPSMAINADENYFHCFSCNRSGNIYNWIQLTEGLTFGEAVEKVANLTNTDVDSYYESETVGLFKLLRKLHHEQDDVKEVERDRLDLNADYYSKYSDEIPQEWIDEGIPADEMKKYEIRVDQSANRIVYPVYDASFNLIGVKGRTRFQNYKELKLMKYMNYHKVGQVDYFTGMKQAYDAINESKSIIVVEGIKSVMKLDSWGYHNTVSAETSVINEKQIMLLVKMGIKEVIIAFDKDVTLVKIKDSTTLLRKYTNVFAVIDGEGLLADKDSPCDKGEEVWRNLYERRMRI